jgi:hypothetical protein
MPVRFGAGVRFLQDAHMRFFQGGLQVYLRVKNFDDSQADFVRLGFQYSPTGQPSGFTDVLITPPPQVVDVSLHNISVSQGRLLFGARHFYISHTFVRQRMATQGYTDPYKVFRDPLVVGLYYNQRLFSIESLTHQEMSGETVYWDAVCNGQEPAVTVSG